MQRTLLIGLTLLISIGYSQSLWYDWASGPLYGGNGLYVGSNAYINYGTQSHCKNGPFFVPGIFAGITNDMHYEQYGLFVNGGADWYLTVRLLDGSVNDLWTWTIFFYIDAFHWEPMNFVMYFDSPMNYIKNGQPIQ